MGSFSTLGCEFSVFERVVKLTSDRADLPMCVGPSDFVLFWAPLLFTYAGLSASSASFVAFGCTSLVLFGATLISTTFIDRVGRRTLWLIGGAGLGSCLLLLGVMYLFAFCFSSTWSIMIRVHSAEVQTSRTRAAASAFGQGTNQLLNFAVAASDPAFLAASSSGPYSTYGTFLRH